MTTLTDGCQSHFQVIAILEVYLCMSAIIENFL